ncbi:beta-ketoacyl synthase N-terminal-like domain-containing protein [Mesohalobacter halotolerans]|uniref:Beta-ketoacyl synthase n=1 Tax=Mesohalobacter halotolerans TaxID=1883405 RepID=A0A4U5TTU0_9FLAO|nr:beta-ketoacyl synthase N-terminal-like domain-containing protein [Mesohalobacter halotolerans]MBS3737567.1 beta-ketoacyl synthase [Psychroflexus sp.]TKS57311.1 beta-ketoacyl synthase [Mesohalobacter halotolerans]
MIKPVFIHYISSVSALGFNKSEVWQSYKNANSGFKTESFNDTKVKVSALSDNDNKVIENIRAEGKLYKSLDKSALMAIFVGRKLFENLTATQSPVGINIGSSRGATQTFEKAHLSYLKHKKVPLMTSPTTTLGNIATSVAQDLGLKGPAVSHSITCSSALHALLNASAFLQSGLLSEFIIGGSEAPLTGFTIAQMQALKLYSKQLNHLPCHSLDFKKNDNTLVLGEAACLAKLSTKPKENAIKVSGVGYATESISHSVALSSEADCLQESMQMALNLAQVQSVDVVVMHAPGTVKGDKSELKAIQKTFTIMPALTTNKWQIGHTFGASGAMSLEMAVLMLENNTFIQNPFYKNDKVPQQINSVMINAVGFGGNAVSVVLEKFQ